MNVEQARGEDRYKPPQHYEKLFEADGPWERAGGRDQTRIFAEYFTRKVRIDRKAHFSLLDVGCALGDAIRHFARRFPNASLHGIDISRTAIERCKADLGGVATFEVGDIRSIRGKYDIIFCSNVLEHFSDIEPLARELAAHCSRLCIMGPYRELKSGRPLAPDPGEPHQVTLEGNSFDVLVREGLAEDVKTWIGPCHGAWSWGFGMRMKEGLKNLVRPLLGKPRQAGA
ncbi:MAG TPA: class I SAM-dependent methyltransferase, partial [Planctomycetota bacterium]|nr:class I SAM-dependent methyltransferase [Planctomycetota bacterium]